MELKEYRNGSTGLPASKLSAKRQTYFSPDEIAAFCSLPRP